jgi:hypothetical protein
MMCQPCHTGDHSRCRDPFCGCCGDYDGPDLPVMADPEQYGREEDQRLAQQLGAWPEAGGR